MAAFYLVLICAMVIMRRQWMDHERLLYPLVQVPLGMIEDGPRARTHKALFAQSNNVGRLCRASDPQYDQLL